MQPRRLHPSSFDAPNDLREVSSTKRSVTQQTVLPGAEVIDHTVSRLRNPATTSMNLARSSHWAICALLEKVYHFTRGSTFHTGAIVLSAASS